MPRLLGRFALTAILAVLLFLGFSYHYTAWSTPATDRLASSAEESDQLNSAYSAYRSALAGESAVESTGQLSTAKHEVALSTSTPQVSITPSAAAISIGQPLDFGSIYNDDQEVAQALQAGNYSNKGNVVEYVRESASLQPTPTSQSKDQGSSAPTAKTRTRTLVVAKLTEENTKWIDEGLADMLIPHGPLHTAIYVVDNSEALLHTPVNKGHEAMAYLTYIIEAYDGLPDVSIFMHSHEATWHNNDLLNLSSAALVRHLNDERVMREGYMSLRCHWEPGCPDWMHPDEPVFDINKQEQVVIAQAWSELFPDEPVPHTLSSACCSQFAVSRDTIRETPIERWKEIREWLRRTSISDHDSGRVFEYFWGFIFAGKSQVCPHPRICYCDGYGVCFENERQYAEFFDVQNGYKKLWDDLIKWREQNELFQNGTAGIEEPDRMQETQIWNRIMEVDAEMNAMKLVIMEQSRDAMQKAALLQKTWDQVGKDEGAWIDLSMAPGEQEALIERRRQQHNGREVKQRG